MYYTPHVLDIKTSAKIMFTLTLSTLYEKRSVEIHVNDFINNLVYQENDTLKTVSGVVTSINTFERVLPRKYHNTNDYIALRHVVESITLDVSEKFKSKLITVDIVNIRNYDTVTRNTLEVEDVTLVNNILKFYSETKPVACVWNDVSINISNGTDDFEYVATVPNINMRNSLVIFDDSASVYNQIIDGPELETVDDSTINNNMSIIMDMIRTNYSEKYTNVDLTDTVNNTIYTPIIKNIATIDTFIANNITYDIDDISVVKLELENENIGVDGYSYINCTPFKMINNDLCICVPIIPYYTNVNGILHIELNGYEKDFILAEEKTHSIYIDEINVLGTPANYTYELIPEGANVFTLKRNHKSSYITVSYKDGDDNILTNQLILIATSSDNGWEYTYRLVDATTLNERMKTESIYMNSVIVNDNVVQTNKTRRLNYKIYAFDTGYMTLVIDVNDVVNN